MQHLIFLVGSFLSASGVSASVVVHVPVPEKPTVKLPTPHGHTGAAAPGSCARLDACLAGPAILAEGGAKDEDGSELKSCIQSFCEDLDSRNAVNKTESRKALCDNKGKKIWDMLDRASKGSKKASLVALKTDNPVTYAAVLQALLVQSSTVNQVADACRLPAADSTSKVSPAVVPVPEKPTALLPTPHGHTGAAEPESCLRLDACLAEGGAEDKERTKLKSCIQSFCEDLHSRNAVNVTDSRKALCDDKGKKVWDMLSRESQGGKKASLVALKRNNPVTYAAVVQALVAQSSAVNQVADACRLAALLTSSRSAFLAPVKEPATSKASMKATALHKSPHHVEVPAKPDVELPQPHGLHETAASKEAPMSCQKLDVCVQKIDAGAEEVYQKKAASDFKACIQSFCEEVHGDKNLNKSDTRTSLCDENGKKAWDLISKAGAIAKADRKASFVALRSHRPDTYSALLQTVFAQRSTVIQMTDACRA